MEENGGSDLRWDMLLETFEKALPGYRSKDDIRGLNDVAFVREAANDPALMYERALVIVKKCEDVFEDPMLFNEAYKAKDKNCTNSKGKPCGKVAEDGVEWFITVFKGLSQIRDEIREGHRAYVIEKNRKIVAN